MAAGILRATGAGLLQGASEEVGKLIEDGSASKIPWQQILPTKNMLLPTLSVESVPAPTAVGKRIRVELYIDVDDKSEVVDSQVQAYHLSVPALVNQGVGCLVVSMAMAALWIHIWNQRTPATGIEKKTDSGSAPSPNAGSGEID